MTLAIILGAQVSFTFGPLILSSFGFDKYRTTLLDIPFGALQCIIILATAWVTAGMRWKWPALAVLLMVVLAGLGLVYTLPRDQAHLLGLLAGYYSLAFVFGCINLVVCWLDPSQYGRADEKVHHDGRLQCRFRDRRNSRPAAF
jgi:hypothetical protein